ncbi:MAG TPA: ribonuclease HII [Thermoanaerobaculia bacterium]|nr:ribonuclease HII [Thermoanaerobaculia bacterium]
MAESVVRSSTTSATSAGKRRESKRGGRVEVPIELKAGRAAQRQVGVLLGELARLAEMSVVERTLRQEGFRVIAGTDEVGRGCLAGPVVAAAVILPGEVLPGVNDSKLLDHGQRRDLCGRVLQEAAAVGVGVVEPETIDRINILRASKLAMRIAVENLGCRPEILLLDAVRVESLSMPQIPLIEGDRRCVSIAAASVVAKVYRDLLMESYDRCYPQYDFANNRGYATESHLTALGRFGPCPIHRRTFEGVDGPRLFETSH